MKLELTLPERPGLLHALPVCDLFLVLWILFMLGSAMSRQPGVVVELPGSQFELERYRENLVVTIASADGDPQLYFGRDAVSFEELERQLKRLQAKGATNHSIVLLRTDGATPVSAQRRVEEMALSLDFRVGLLGADVEEELPAPPAEEAKPPSEPQPEPEPEKEAE